MAAAYAQESPPASPDDGYFNSFPVVLTASRLDQPLNEAPGAITVIDRHTIRQSGARTLADVLRLVPGYLSGGWNGANPLAAYHIPIDDFGARNLVLIDGRTVYSSVYRGDTHRGMMDVMLEDIERIEVLRGANSAAFGANAMFGVINIITRHSADTDRAELSLTRGNVGIEDRRASFSGVLGLATFHVSAGEQRDSGYNNAPDDRRLGQLHGRLDVKPSASDDITVSLGATHLDSGEGFADNPDNYKRTAHSRDSYIRGQWRHAISTTDEVKISLDYSEDVVEDAYNYPVAGFTAVIIDSGGTGRRTGFEMQRKFASSAQWRALLGVGYKEEATRSPSLYARPDWLSFHEERVFGTLEWHATPQWLLNGGLFVGQHSMASTYAAPRVMLNWLPTPEHTVRLGATESVRTPSLIEYKGDIRFYLGDVLMAQTVAAQGQVEPERLRSVELGYLGRFPQARLTLDLRAFHERLDSLIRNKSYNRSTPLPKSGLDVTDFVNFDGFDIKGIEAQLRWKPHPSSEIWVNQAMERLKWDDAKLENQDERRPPRYATTVAWFQKLGDAWQFSLTHQRLGAMTWLDYRDWLPATRRTDARLAYNFGAAKARGEVSVTVQSIEGGQPTYLTRRSLEVPRRAFIQYKLAF
jgi:iron complex outermembrane recepter protein